MERDRAVRASWQRTRGRSSREKAGRHPDGREVIARAIGYNSLNGASATVISAMAKYGLIEPTENGFRVRSLALDILPLTKEDGNYATAIEQAAFAPTLFGELRDEFGDQLPSDNNLRAKLIKRGFNPKSVEGVIRAYRETLEYLNGEIAGDTGEDRDVVANLSNQSMNEPTNDKPSNTVDSGLYESNAPAGKTYIFQLSSSCEARLTLVGDVTQESLDNLVQFVNLTKTAFPQERTPTAVAPGHLNGNGSSDPEEETVGS